MPHAELTRGERVIAFIENFCVIPEGEKVGQPVVLAPFQKRFILAVYDNKHGTDTAILSIARKNAKTGLIAFIVLAHIVGPECVLNSRIISGARSREQAAEVYNLASKCVELSPQLRDLIKPVPSKKMLIGLPMNVEYQAISADGKTAHGKSPILAILDEVGQITGPQDDFVDAITTAQGAYDNPLLIYISTQAPNDSDYFSILIDDALENKPPHTICHVYCAEPDDDIGDHETWQKANPALGLFRSLKDVKKQAKKAKRMPSFENTFRNLVLNMRVAVKSPFINKLSWTACGKPVDVELSACEEVYGGLDLSMRTDLTALVFIGRIGKMWYVFCYFWTPEIGLVDRSKKDRAPYDVWVRKGLLHTTPGATIDYEFIARQVGEIVDGVNLVALAFDRWRIEYFKKDLERIGLDLPLVAWGQGFKDMAPALDAIESKILNGQIRHGNNPVLTMCMANSMVTKDASGNRKLDKTKTSGKIDGMVALAMAAGVAERDNELGGSLDEFLSNPISI